VRTRAARMYQLNFSDQAIAELNRLDKLQQLELMSQFSAFRPEDVETDEEVGHLKRGKKSFYRLRAGDFRIYFEIIGGETLFAHYILHRHTLADFVFRFKLPFREEQLIEQHQSFWQYLDSLKKGGEPPPE